MRIWIWRLGRILIAGFNFNELGLTIFVSLIKCIVSVGLLMSRLGYLWAFLTLTKSIIMCRIRLGLAMCVLCGSLFSAAICVLLCTCTRFVIRKNGKGFTPLNSFLLGICPSTSCLTCCLKISAGNLCSIFSLCILKSWLPGCISWNWATKSGPRPDHRPKARNWCLEYHWHR